MQNLRRILLGRRLASEELHQTKLNVPIGLAVFSSDALSSVAYGTQSIMETISIAGPAVGLGGAMLLGAMTWSWGAALGITGLLLILLMSYNQTIHAYPGGGGAYLVAKDNLGELAAQTAGASLLIDYVLTVAVSVSAGISAITSAFPGLDPHRVALALVVMAFIAVMNLRGLKESGALFAIPTYGFVLCIFVTLGIGTYRAFTHSDAELMASVQRQIPSLAMTGKLAGIWLFARAYAAGCTALTGVEAISNGVTAFKDPSTDSAAKTMRLMVFLLGTMFLGITFFSNRYGITYFAGASETLLSSLIRTVVGGHAGMGRIFWVVAQGFTMAILAVAANTSYADFPRLAAIMAKDGFLPRQFTSQGDRLVFSNGIFILSLAAGALMVGFGAHEDHLLDLYALGVFIGFTLSQTGMVLHWRKVRGEHWHTKAFVNGLGAATTFTVMCVIVATKFTHGVWVVVLLLPALVITFSNIHRHYIRVKSKLAASRTEFSLERRNRVVVLVSGIHHGVIQALNYAKLIAEHGQVEALTVDFPDHYGKDSQAFLKLQADWPGYCEGIPLRVIRSPYRKVVEPILEELDRMRRAEPEFITTVIIPEFVTRHWWEHLLHNQTALRIKGSLLNKPKTIVISVPYHLDPVPE
ncbi:MAG TPA: APC family permease [Holophagaceae bacterium]|nr:APC family permease [Holophagaceae bacterium]